MSKKGDAVLRESALVRLALSIAGGTSGQWRRPARCCRSVVLRADPGGRVLRANARRRAGAGTYPRALHPDPWQLWTALYDDRTEGGWAVSDRMKKGLAIRGTWRQG